MDATTERPHGRYWRPIAADPPNPVVEGTDPMVTLSQEDGLVVPQQQYWKDPDPRCSPIGGR